MCTVSYVNINENEFIFTFNRDESTKRATAFTPEISTVNDKTILKPTDPKGGGTWIFSSEEGITVGLLNGEFKPHKMGGMYRKSRGLIVLDVLKSSSVNNFIDSVNLQDIEPFTMVLIQHKDKIELTELVWDGLQKHVKNKNSSENHLWCSSPLYSSDTKLQRTQAFLSQEYKTKDDIVSFHHQSKVNYKSIPVLIDRPNTVKTLSTTQITSTKEQTEMVYFDLLQDEKASISINKSLHLGK